ncbi:MAG: YMGG-like glycine zipper-containing protein, partial [Pyrinomonadaceae bacterium]
QNRTNLFSRSFDAELNRDSWNSWERDEARRHLNEFENATNRLSISTRDANAAAVQNVLEHAAYLNSFVANNQLSSRAESDWNLLKTDLNQLASAHNIAWNWTTTPSPGPSYGSDGQLTGTYRLNSSQSGNVQAAADAATRNLPTSQRQRVYESLLRRLEAPDVLAIDQRGNNVTIASSRAPQINFVADGREHVETTQSGRTVRVRASLSGDQLNIVRTGDRAQDFTVTFDPTDNGRRLIVTRRLYSDQLNQPVIVQSYYDRTSDVAQLDIGNQGSPNTGGVNSDFIIPNGTQLVAVLNSNLSTQTTREGDRFTMTVRSPGQYDGTQIEGHVSTVNRSGRITGRSEMTLNFDNVRLRDGRSYRFAGILESVRTPGNETVRVDNEGAVREDDQTGRTVKRTAIGTAVGAIIGAIAGGGKGAAIGAVIGAGAGAGSVYIQGQQDLELPSGTEITIRATGPR